MRKSVIGTIIGINIVAFILQVLMGESFTLAFSLQRGDLFVRPWTILTSMFLHGDIVHILFNMYVLFMFGPIVEQRIGPNRFLFIYFLSGVLAGAVSSFIYPLALGASGAIMGIIGVVIMILPNLRVLFFFFIPMPLWIAGIIIAMFDLIGTFNPTSQVANMAHLVGMGTGLIYGLSLRKKKRKFHRKFSSKTHMSEDDIDEYLRSGRI